MLESLGFSYNGKHTSEFGLLNVNMGNGMFEEPFSGKTDIVETIIRGNDKPLFNEVKRSPIQLDISVAFKDVYDGDLLKKVARWLIQDQYKPLIFDETPNRIFYCILVDEPKLTHTGMNEGYIKLSMRCDSHYSYSPVYVTPSHYDFSNNNAGGSTLEFDNQGDVICKPEIYIDKIGSGSISIVNITNGGKLFALNNLIDNETVYVDNEMEYVESSLQVNRYKDFNFKYLEMVTGKNIINVYGDCKIKFRYQFKNYQG